MERASIFLLFIVVTTGIVIWGGSHMEAQAPTGEEPDVSAPKDSCAIDKGDSAKTDPAVVAYYFHTTRRCYSCKKIEAYSKEAIEGGFAEELKNGTLEFHSVNTDEAENKHFIKDYQLYTKSLVISKIEDGKQTKWKNITRVWSLSRSKHQFFEYVRDEIRSYLEEN